MLAQIELLDAFRYMEC